MNCKKCGCEMAKNDRFCPECGTDNAAPSDLSAAGGEIVAKSFSNRNKVILISVIAALLLTGGLVTAIAVNNGTKSAESIMALAERYLNEQNYEQAVIEFLRVIEIEPMNVDAYLGLAEAYWRLGERDKAAEILAKGYDVTGSEELLEFAEQSYLYVDNDETCLAIEKMLLDYINGRGSVDVDMLKDVTALKIMGENYIGVTIGNRRGSDGSDYSERFNVDFSFLQFCPKLKYLYINRIYEIDLNAIGGLNSLKSLIMVHTDVQNIAPLAALTNLEELEILNWSNGHDISGLSPVDASPLAGLTNLRRLDLEDVKLTDISPLAGLTNLTHLDLNGNNITDISPLAGLTKLDYLSLHMNEIVDISPVQGLTNLTDLHLSNNDIIDISPLAGMTNLTILYLSSNNIINISPLAGLTKLENLSIGSNEWSDVSPLAGLINLRELSIDRSEITDISFLAGMTNLRHLALSDNEIVDISLLAGLTNLRYLNLSYNKIVDISPLAGLTNIDCLYINSNDYTDISPIMGLDKLTDLRIDTYRSDEEQIEAFRAAHPDCNISG